MMKQLLEMPSEEMLSVLLYDKETRLMINLFISDQHFSEDAPEDTLWNIQVFKPCDLEVEVESELPVDLKTVGFVTMPPTATPLETLVACLTHLDLPNFSPETLSTRFTPLYVNGT